MLILTLLLSLIHRPILQADTLEEQTAKLKALVASSPRLSLSQTDFKPQFSSPIDFVSSLAVDKSGLIYLFQRGDQADPVIVVNGEGKVLRSFGKGLYKIPHSVRIDAAGNIWTVDANSSMVYKFTPEGKQLMEINVGGVPANPRSQFCGTTDIAFAPGGRLFISDGYCNARILEYSADGKRVREWGRHGTGPGEFNLPHGLTIDRENILYVADRENGRIQRFDLSGKFLGEWTNLGKTFSITFTRSGELWIGTQPRTSANGADGWLMKIDRKTGRILGYVDTKGHHSIDVTPKGQPMSGARPDRVLWFK